MTPASAVQDPDDRPVLGRRVLAHIVLAFAAGGLVFLVEAIDRLRVLRVNLNGAGDAARLAMLLGATVLFVALAAATFGVVWTVADSVRGAFDRRFGERFGRWRAVASLLAGAAVVSVIARVVSGLVPWALQFPVYRIIQRIDNRLFSLGLIAEYPRVVFTLLLIGIVVAIMALHAWLFSERGPRARAAAIGFSILGLVAVAGGYYADSRVEFTRYEFMFHIPAEVLY